MPLFFPFSALQRVGVEIPSHPLLKSFQPAMPSVANVRLALRRTPGNLLIPLPFTSNWLRSAIFAHVVPVAKTALKFAGRNRLGRMRRHNAERFPPQFRSPQSGFVFSFLRHPGFPMVKTALKFASRTNPGHVRRNNECAVHTHLHFLSPQIGFVPPFLRRPGFPW
jgi:hypothetical protein